MLMDLATCDWHAPYLPLFNMPEVCLPRIVSNSEVYCMVSGGILDGVPVAGCLGDQMAAVLGGSKEREEGERWADVSDMVL